MVIEYMKQQCRHHKLFRDKELEVNLDTRWENLIVKNQELIKV